MYKKHVYNIVYMFYNGIIFDLDNTLYNYDICHEYALNKVIYYLLEYCPNDFSYEYINSLYLVIANKSKNELGNTAPSHNKTTKHNRLELVLYQKPLAFGF